jgi:class 3 adenylate cyclase
MEKSPDIEGILRRFLRCFAQSDVEGLRALSSKEPGRRAIGTDPREWSAGPGWETMFTQLPEMAAAGGMKVQFLDSDGFEEGAVGWGAANCVAGFGNSEWPLRLTGVFRLEQGHWHVVQVHFSVGVTNEDAYGVELSTPLEAVAAAVQVERPNLVATAAPDGTVTLLFTDIEASTELAERLGDSRWMELVRWHRSKTNDAAQKHTGYVVKSLGDGFMIAFPSASEAIQCAMEIQSCVAAGWDGNKIRVRAGIHSGDAVRDVDDFYGHAVTVAARIAALARGGEILVTRVVQELVRGRPFSFGSQRVESLKGIEGEIELAPIAASVPSR